MADPWNYAELEELIARCEYREWKLRVEPRLHGGMLVIRLKDTDNYNPEQQTIVHHTFPLPPAPNMKGRWQRWLFEQILLVERHEACEQFMVDGKMPFDPHAHDSPYTIREAG